MSEGCGSVELRQPDISDSASSVTAPARIRTRERKCLLTSAPESWSTSAPDLAPEPFCFSVRRRVAQVDIFLWEGHYRTLTDEFGFLTWDEPLPPSLIVLQSCLALKEDEGGPGVRAMLVWLVGKTQAHPDRRWAYLLHRRRLPLRMCGGNPLAGCNSS